MQVVGYNHSNGVLHPILDLFHFVDSSFGTEFLNPLLIFTSFISAILDCVFKPSRLCSLIRLHKKPYWQGQSSYAWLITYGAVV